MKLAGLVVMLGFVWLPVFALSQTLSYSGKNIPLTELFKVIKTQTGLVFFYDCSLLKDAKPVTVSWKNITIGQALEECFKNQSITWVLEGKTLTVIKKQQQAIARAEVEHFPQ